VRKTTLLLAVVAAALLALLGGCDEGSPTLGEDTTEDTVPGEVDPLARRYAPVVWVHRGEDSGPASPAQFLRESTLYWRRPFLSDRRIADRGTVVPARLGTACGGLDAGCYTQDGALASDFTRPHDGARERPRDASVSEGFYLDPPDSAHRGEVGTEAHVPIYYEIRPGEETRITYWFFYGFSRPNKPFLGGNAAGLLSHEGDWENVDVVLDGDDEPRAVLFYGHGHPRPTPWRAVCKLVEGGGEDCDSSSPGRPVVYSALFSHASYATPDEERDEASRVCKKLLVRICSYDFRNRGFLWDPLAEPGDLREVRAEPWYGFGGAWGHAGRFKDTTGPLGPSKYKLPSDPEPGEQQSVAPSA
jgi:hypothetical protein